MSIIQSEIQDARVLDLFAGSGALGIEALSRGARHVDFVELSGRSLRALGENLDLVGAGAAASLHPGDALRFVGGLEGTEYDVAFADPPYRMGLAASVANRWLQVPFARVLGVEHERGVELEGGDRRAYGDTVVTFFRTP